MNNVLDYRITTLENKFNKVIGQINQTIININDMFSDKIINCKVNESNNYNLKNLFVENPEVIKRYDNKFLMTIKEEVHYYFHENDKMILQHIFKEIFNNFGEYIDIYKNNIIISAKNNSKTLLIYYHEKNRKQIIECDSTTNGIKLFYNILFVYDSKNLNIYFKDNEIWLKIQTINDKILYLDYNDYFIYNTNDKLKIYEYKNKKFSFIKDFELKNSENFYYKNNLIYLSHNNALDIYDINFNKINSIKNNDKSIFPCNFYINNDIIYILYVKNKFQYLAIYKNFVLIKDIKLWNSGIYNNYLDMFDGKIIISNYQNIYQLEEEIKIYNWIANYSAINGKIDFLITGEIISNNYYPFIQIYFSESLPKIKEGFYYNNIPIISANFYDIDNNNYVYGLNLKNIKFSSDSLYFEIINIPSDKYHYKIYLNISYFFN